MWTKSIQNFGLDFVAQTNKLTCSSMCHHPNNVHMNAYGYINIWGTNLFLEYAHED